MKRIYFIRHAEAQSGGRSDFERELSPKGKGDAMRLGALLRSENLLPRLIVASSAVRALTTARIIAAALGVPQALRVSRELYDINLWDLAEFVRGLDDADGLNLNLDDPAADKFKFVARDNFANKNGRGESNHSKNGLLNGFCAGDGAVSGAEKSHKKDIFSSEGAPEGALGADILRASRNGADEPVFIVGHNPAIGGICELLGERAIGKFPPCAICGLEFEAKNFIDIAEHSGRIVMFDYPQNA
nr:histidine phosphatase family protein [uncultured Campylobacter sp.]